MVVQTASAQYLVSKPVQRAASTTTKQGPFTVVKTMLEIRTAADNFVVFDTFEDEPIMRFDSRDEALDLIVELTMAETRAQLHAWVSPKERAQRLR